VASVYFWIRSYHGVHYFNYTDTQDQLWTAASATGGIQIACLKNASKWDWIKRSLLDPHNLGWRVIPRAYYGSDGQLWTGTGDYRYHDWLGLRWAVGLMGLPPNQLAFWSIRFPYWLLVLLTSICPVFWLYSSSRTWQAERRKRSGRCAQCSYDLRATPARCPECGATAEKNFHRDLS
jgi:hypothetical protein